MNEVHLYLKDYSGRDFGGLFEAQSVTIKDGKVVIDLQYSGTKANKRLSVAAITIDQSVLDRLGRP
jgi:hypothetical protein